MEMLLSAVHHHRTCSAKQMWPTQEVSLKYQLTPNCLEFLYLDLYPLAGPSHCYLISNFLYRMSKIFQHEIFSNYLPSTVYQGAYKLGLFYIKEQLFSHALQLNTFHHKLKFSFNFTIIIYPFPQWHLRSPISISLHCHQKVSSMQQNHYPSLARVD